MLSLFFLIRSEIPQYGVVARLPLPDVIAIYVVDDTIEGRLSFADIIAVYIIDDAIIAGLSLPYVIAVYVIDDAIEGRLSHPNIIAIYVANNIIRWTLTQPDNIVTSMKHTRLDFPLKIQRQKYINTTHYQHVKAIQYRHNNCILFGYFFDVLKNVWQEKE